MYVVIRWGKSYFAIGVRDGLFYVQYENERNGRDVQISRDGISSAVIS